MIKGIDWSDVFLAVVGGYAVLRLFRLQRQTALLENRMVALAAAMFMITAMLNAVMRAPWWPDTINPDLIHDLFAASTIASVLSALGMVIRDSKPLVTRFPLTLTFVPFLLVPAHALVSHTFVLKEMLFAVYEGGAILIGIAIHALHIPRDRRNLRVVIGMLLFACALGFTWASPPAEWYTWLRTGLFGLAVVVTTHGYLVLHGPSKSKS